MASPVLLVAHGAGSSPEVARAAFAPWAGAGWEVRSWWLRGHGPRAAPTPASAPAAEDLADLAAAAAGATVVAGISYGAHLVARWAAAVRGPMPQRLVLAMPAWTGPPGPVAAATLLQADAFEARSIAAELARITAAHPGWVSDALAASWPLHGPQLVGALRQIAASEGPTAVQLAAIAAPTTVVALAQDPLHPLAVARAWAAALPAGELRLARGTALADLGEAALAGAGAVSGFR